MRLSTLARGWVLVAAVALGGCASGIGDSCTTDQDCGGRLCASDSTFPGGYCTQRCTAGDSGSCPTGATCVVHAAQAVCLRTCHEDIECRSGYKCLSYRGSGSYCLSPDDR